MKLLIRNGKVLRTNDGSMIGLEEPRLPLQEQIDVLEEQVDLSENRFVSLRLASLPTTTGFRQGGNIYVDDGQIALRMSMTALKDLNTKIITTDNVDNVDMSKLTTDDFIYERSEN